VEGKRALRFRDDRAIRDFAARKPPTSRREVRGVQPARESASFAVRRSSVFRWIYPRRRRRNRWSIVIGVSPDDERLASSQDSMTLGAYDRPRALTCAKTRVFAGTSARSSWSDNALERRRDPLARIIERERDRRSIARITVGRQTRATGWSSPRTFYRRSSSRIIVNRSSYRKGKVGGFNKMRSNRFSFDSIIEGLRNCRGILRPVISWKFSFASIIDVLNYFQRSWIQMVHLILEKLKEVVKVRESGGNKKIESFFFHERTASSIARQSSRNRDRFFFFLFVFFYLSWRFIFLVKCRELTLRNNGLHMQHYTRPRTAYA